MTDQKIGAMAWTDLTVPDATALKAFYADVCGWTPQEHPMGEYADYTMLGPDGTAQAGICHARGVNANLPPVWVPYIVVASVEGSVATAQDAGGTLLELRHRADGTSILAILQDPQGASFAIWQAAGGKAVR